MGIRTLELVSDGQKKAERRFGGMREILSNACAMEGKCEQPRGAYVGDEPFDLVPLELRRKCR